MRSIGKATKIVRGKILQMLTLQSLVVETNHQGLQSAPALMLPVSDYSVIERYRSIRIVILLIKQKQSNN